MWFSHKTNEQSGGLMDVIRCDEQQYLVWKWSPTSTPDPKQNAIRYGSSLRVKEGELAVFVYQQPDGPLIEHIYGPYDGTIKTANFPILTSIVGSAFGGQSPFQAEIYFVNLQGNIQVRFAVPWFDVYDFRYLDLGVPVAVRGMVTFHLTDPKEFFRLNRLTGFSLQQLQRQIQDAISRLVKTEVSNAPERFQIPVLQIERRITDLNGQIEPRLAEALGNDFGINLKRFDLSAIEFDTDSEAYHSLRRATADQAVKNSDRMTDLGLKNTEESLRIQRKGMELGVEAEHLTVHQINKQADVLKTAAGNLGAMGSQGGGMNPAGMMTGMMMGTAMGGQMANMVGQVAPDPQAHPPSPPSDVLYYSAIHGQQSGPFTLVQLRQAAASNQFTRSHHVWREGMAAWVLASDAPEVMSAFAAVPPPPPTT